MKSFIVILALLAIAICAEVGTVQLTPQNRRVLTFQATFHYEDPSWSNNVASCTGSRTEARTWEGLDGYFACMPEAFGEQNKCYQDGPVGTTATPMPLFVEDDQKTIRCAMVCSGQATGICGPRSECVILPGIAQAQVGVCLNKEQ